MNAGGSALDLRVVDDVAGAALGLFLDVQPRTLLLSGGATPEPFYKRLAGLTDYPWGEVELFLTDERCVPGDHRDSNGSMIQAALLAHVQATWYPIDGARCNAEGYERRLKSRFGERPWFDFAVYGLGSDGHVASLFPGRPEPEITNKYAVRVPVPGAAPRVPRVTLTLPVLSAAAVGVFLVTGPSKREALGRLMKGEDIPACRVTPQRAIVIADRVAGEGL
jgi:6-phosphogluconolactonase